MCVCVCVCVCVWTHVPQRDEELVSSILIKSTRGRLLSLVYPLKEGRERERERERESEKQSIRIVGRRDAYSHCNYLQQHLKINPSVLLKRVCRCSKKASVSLFKNSF